MSPRMGKIGPIADRWSAVGTIRQGGRHGVSHLGTITGDSHQVLGQVVHLEKAQQVLNRRVQLGVTHLGLLRDTGYRPASRLRTLNTVMTLDQSAGS